MGIVITSGSGEVVAAGGGEVQEIEGDDGASGGRG